MNESKNNLSIRRIGLCWEATRAPRWTRRPQAGARGDLRSGMPACGIDHNAINPGLRGKTSTKTKRISNLTAVRQSDIHAEPVQIREDLIGHKDIKVTGITSEEFDNAELDKVLQPLLARINAELGEAFKAPPAIDPAHASPPSAGGYFGSVGYSSATKDVSIHKTGTELFEYSIQKVVERKTVASGFIGIGSYAKEVQDRLVTIVPKGPFKSAYLALPPAAGLEQLGVVQADFQVGIKKGGKKSDFQLARWNPAEGWTSQGKSSHALTFGLLDNGVSDPDFKETKFVTQILLTTGLQVSDTSQEFDAFDGQKALRSIGQPSYEVIEVDASSLSFRQMSPASKLVAVNISLSTPTDSISQALRPANVNGVKSPPAPLRWLIPKPKPGEPPVRLVATIKFQMVDGTTKDWSLNGRNLREIFPNPYIYLDDTLLASAP